MDHSERRDRKRQTKAPSRIGHDGDGPDAARALELPRFADRTYSSVEQAEDIAWRIYLSGDL